MAIQYWNRKNQRMEEEAVYGDGFVRLLYGNRLGFALADHLLVRKFFSRWYGMLQDSRLSGAKVPAFVEKFRIPMEQYEPGPFPSFNDFFIRRFRLGRRPFPQDPARMGAFAEARYLAFENTEQPVMLPVKGLGMDPFAMLGNAPQKERFRGGPCLLARLCPVDYHRFHFPDGGIVTHSHQERGKLHSVNPLALQRHPGLFLANERQVSLLQTENFGLLAYVEVGALCVGRIVQSHESGRPFARGAEKGYFLFGGSTVIVYGEPGRWTPSPDLLAQSAKGIETLVELGQPVAQGRSA